MFAAVLVVESSCGKRRHDFQHMLHVPFAVGRSEMWFQHMLRVAFAHHPDMS